VSQKKYESTEEGKEFMKEYWKRFQKGGSAPDIFCEDCPKGYHTKKRSTYNAHRKTCPAGKASLPNIEDEDNA
jgi:hypothetical protein